MFVTLSLSLSVRNCCNIESLKLKLWKLEKLIVTFSQQTNENSKLEREFVRN